MDCYVQIKCVQEERRNNRSCIRTLVLVILPYFKLLPISILYLGNIHIS